MRKILVALLMLVVVVGVGFALYFLFFGAPAGVLPGEEEPEPTGPGTGLPEAPVAGERPTDPGDAGLPEVEQPDEIADGGLTVVRPVAPTPTVGASLNTNGSISYYDRNDGRFYRMNDDGTVSSLSERQFFNVDDATFDPLGNQAIIEYPDGANIYFDFRTGEQVTLPAHWDDFEFTPQGQEIVAKSLGIDPAARFLVVANPDGSGARPVQELGDNADKVTVTPSPNNQMIAVSETGRKFGPDRQEVYFLGKNQENFKSMVVEGLDFRPNWNPDGERLLYSVAGSVSDFKPLLWIVDSAGDNIGRNRRIINVNTWADKCTFADSSTLYCAVPTELPRGAGLQPAIADDTSDEIYRIDIETGLQTRVAVPEGDHTVDTIMLSPDKKNLYFTDKRTGILNRVQVAP